MDKPLTANDLATHYFNICNTALAQRRREFPYNLIIPLMDRFFSGESVSLRIEDDDGAPLDYVTTGFVGGQFTPVYPGVHTPDARFSLKRSYLEQVVEHADDYIRHPERLDWSWLTDRLGPFGDADRF
jgi:hypothetical protein